MASVAFVLSLGSPLTINGHKTSITLPFALFAHLPALGGYEARRFALFTDLFVAAMVAIGMDELWKRLQVRLLARPSEDGAKRSRRARWLLSCSRSSCLSYRGRHKERGRSLFRRFFTSTAVDAIPCGGAVLAYPYPDFESNAPFALLYRPIESVMLDQAVSGMRFNLIGGFGWFPASNGQGSISYPARLTPGSVQALFDSVYYGVTPPKTNMTRTCEVFCGSTTSSGLGLAATRSAFWRSHSRSQPFSPAASWLHRKTRGHRRNDRLAPRRATAQRRI